MVVQVSFCFVFSDLPTLSQIEGVQNLEDLLKSKAFPCHLCGKYFANKAKLERHVVVHTGEKKFECHICNRAFNRKDNLKVHMWNKHARNVTGDMWKRM